MTIPKNPKGPTGPVGTGLGVTGLRDPTSPTGPQGPRFVLPHITVMFDPRKCPECKSGYYGLHPVSDCKYGTAERIMDS